MAGLRKSEEFRAQIQAGMPIDAPLTPMPLRDDAAARTAKRKSAAAQRKRRGRASTILTALSDELEGMLGG